MDHFGNIHTKIKSLLKKLDIVQKEPPSSDSDAREVSIQAALQEQLIQEEQLWKQKSREQWLNTKYFYASTATKRRYNSITSLKLDNGSFLNKRKDIGDEFVKFYSDLFSSSNPF